MSFWTQDGWGRDVLVEGDRFKISEDLLHPTIMDKSTGETYELASSHEYHKLPDGRLLEVSTGRCYALDGTEG